MLAIGFLLVILSSALFANYFPLLVVATFVLAPLPNAVCARLAGPDDYIEDSGSSGFLDLGRFVTGFLVVTGIGILAPPDPRAYVDDADMRAQLCPQCWRTAASSWCPP